MSYASIASTWRAQTNSIHAIALREMQSRSKSRFGFLMMLLDPCLKVLAMYMLRAVIKGVTETHGVPVALFLITGYMSHYAFRHTVTDVAGVVPGRAGLLAYPNVTVLDNILGKTVVVWLNYTLVNIVLSTLAVCVTGASPPSDMLQVMFGFNCSMWLGFMLGLLVGTALRFFPILDHFVSPCLRIDMFMSGAMFYADELPKWMIPYVSWNPGFHATEIVRQGWSATYHSPIANPYYVLLCCIIGTAFAMVIERNTRYFKFT